MRLAVHYWNQDPYSLAMYRDNVLKHLSNAMTVLPFRGDASPDPSADVIWEPGLAGSRRPPAYILHASAPIVATVHGAAPFVLPWRENYRTLPSWALGKRDEWRCLRQWSKVASRIDQVIAVSNYAANEIAAVFGIERASITPIYHGVDHDIFNAEGATAGYEKPYFLLVAQYQPKKNLDRVFAAYRTLEGDRKPDLVAIVPGYRQAGAEGIRIFRDKMSPGELAKWYRGALAFVFPSLHETFGLPIVEAMACGCPVITSRTTACEEIGDGAAVLVDPYKTDEIRDAMSSIWRDGELRNSLSAHSPVHAQKFTWDASARAHAQVFEKCKIGEKVEKSHE